MNLADAISPDRATCLFCDDFPRVQLELQKWIEGTEGTRLVSVELSRIPDISALAEELLAQLAHSVLLLWPDWYSGAYSLAHPSEFGVNADMVCRDHPGVNRNWLSAAASSCDSGQPPVLKQFSDIVQARQLRFALADQQLLLTVFLKDPDPPADRLLGLARAAEWLSREADAGVVVVLPTSMSDRSELDSINSTALIWREEPVANISDSPRTAQEISPHGASEERKHQVCPIIGRPHPGSPGEQRLFKQLARDDELRGLFNFNQRVTSVLDNRFIVDLLWRDGRIVVEIDGYGWHSSRSMFNSDRQRDYELTISNYLVLRLPHDFVVQDPALACERIREFVQFRRQHPLHQEMTA